jgi:hypothetical protein
VSGAAFVCYDVIHKVLKSFPAATGRPFSLKRGLSLFSFGGSLISGIFRMETENWSAEEGEMSPTGWPDDAFALACRENSFHSGGWSPFWLLLRF